MYNIKRVSGKYLAINDRDRSKVYIVPDDIFMAMVRSGVNRNNISDDVFLSIRQRKAGIVPYKAFDGLNRKELKEPEKMLRTSHEKQEILRKREASGKKVKTNREKSREIQRLKIRIAASALVLVMAWSGIGVLKKKLAKDADNGYTTEQDVDNDNDYIDYDDENSNNEDIIEDEDDLDNYEESTEYYYNLDGEVDRQNYDNAMKHEEEFRKAEEKFGIDYRLLVAIACQESSGIHDPNDSKYATGIMKIQNVHKGEDAPYVNNITNENDSININEDNLENVQSNIDIGAALLQHCLYLAYEKGYERGMLTKEEIIPAALYGYNNGPTALVNMLLDYEKSGEESYNSFIRTTISTNIDNEDLVWHLKYPALVFNERNEDDIEFWANYIKDGQKDTFKTKPVNESKIYAASMKR